LAWIKQFKKRKISESLEEEGEDPNIFSPFSLALRHNIAMSMGKGLPNFNIEGFKMNQLMKNAEE